MAFPKKFMGITIGWEDRGQMNYKKSSIENGIVSYTYEMHSFCSTRLNVGLEKDGESFKFCPMCLIKCQ